MQLHNIEDTINTIDMQNLKQFKIKYPNGEHTCPSSLCKCWTTIFCLEMRMHLIISATALMASFGDLKETTQNPSGSSFIA